MFVKLSNCAKELKDTGVDKYVYICDVIDSEELKLLFQEIYLMIRQKGIWNLKN